MEKFYLGLDIGGTKCAAIIGSPCKEGCRVISKVRFDTDTPRGWRTVTAQLLSSAEAALGQAGIAPSLLSGIGVSCGGPLSSVEGVIKCPPNLPDWDNVPITAMLEEKFGVHALLQNDANACALAEWRFGAGKGSKNMIFLTFGTGLGAGLILDGRLYSGTNDMAGEAGHMRLAPDGPEGYGKCGSFEGFCSGGGIARLASQMLADAGEKGKNSLLFATSPSAKSVAEAALKGDELALDIYKVCGDYLGRGLALLVDLLNPQVIVIGSIFARSGELIIPSMRRSLEREALPLSLEVCKIVPAALGDDIGDCAALGVAMEAE